VSVRAWLLLTATLLAGTAGGWQPAGPALHPLDTAEFPPQDASLEFMLREGIAKKLAAAALVSAPDGLDTLRLAAEGKRSADVLRILDRTVRTTPAQIGDAFQVLSNHSTLFRSGDSRGEWDRFQEIVAAAKRRSGELQPEEAARAAWQLMFFEPYDWRKPNAQAVRLEAFVEAYPDTAAALDAEIGRILTGLPSYRQLDELEAFAASHPGTVAAAKATCERGFQLAGNISVTGVEPRGSDPTDRFMKVLEIVRDLESGRYPESEWVDRAPSIVTGFFASNPAYSPENLDRVIEASYTFAKAHYRPQPDGTIDYLLTDKMPALLKLKGDEIGGMDAMFSQLERDVDSSGAKYLRGRYYLRGMRESQAPGERALFLRKAIDTLDELQRSGSGIFQRKALATLATLRMNEGDFAGARANLLKYLAAYADTDWAWVAAARAGLANIELGQPVQAAAELTGAADRYTLNPVARVLAHAYAARAEEASGRFDRALAHDRQALRDWDDDYGPRYSIYWMVKPRPGQFETGGDGAMVDKVSLAQRAAALARSLSQPGGEVLERGRWLLARDRWTEATDTLRPIAAGSSATARDARPIIHQAELYQALELAAADGPGSNKSNAFDRIERLTREPLDFPVVAARLAQACLLLRRGDVSSAETRTGQALDDWHAPQRLDEPVSPLERDVADIRRAVLLPDGGGVYGSQHWNAFEWPASGTPPFAIVNPTVRVTLASGEITKVTLRQSLGGDRKVLFLGDDDLNLLRYVLAKLGGARRRVPTAIMETPNQPVGESMNILALWNKFFAARPGHWGGWELETYPVVTKIEFIDAARTKAEAAVTIGYSGGIVLLEKVEGHWVARRLTSRWIT
jgi:tetratricopeptide (TPR) repeat protein